MLQRKISQKAKAQLQRLTQQKLVKLEKMFRKIPVFVNVSTNVT